MRGSPSERISQLVDAIHRYLSAHPDAADSEQGIAAWWMPTMGIEANAAEVAEALDQMQKIGQVDKHALADGRMIYRTSQRPS